MQIAPLDALTTIAYDRPPTFLVKDKYAPSELLYFLFTLKFDGENFDGKQRLQLKKCLSAAIEMFGGKSKAIEFEGKRIRLLIGLPLHTAFADFVERLRIFFKCVVRRKLNAKQFVWDCQYQVSTVSFSQIETVSRELRQLNKTIDQFAGDRQFMTDSKSGDKHLNQIWRL